MMPPVPSKAPEPLTDGEEIVGPEGVEEKLVWRETFEITLTGGGKYRKYFISADGRRDPVPVIHDNFQSAWEGMYSAMITLALAALSPGTLVEHLIKRKSKL